MTLYDNLLKTSTRMMSKYGQAVTLRQYTFGGGDYDPSQGEATPNPPASAPVDSTRYGITIDAPGKKIDPKYGQNWAPNTSIINTDKWMYLDANGPRPSLQDHIIIAGTEFSIIDIQETKPSTTAMMYLLVLRA